MVSDEPYGFSDFHPLPSPYENAICLNENALLLQRSVFVKMKAREKITKQATRFRKTRNHISGYSKKV